MLFSLFTLLLLTPAFAQKWGSCSHEEPTNPLYHNGHYYPEGIPISFRTLQGVELNLDEDTIDTENPQSFDFGLQGWAQQYFYFNTTSTLSYIDLLIWDCYCPGDGFFIYVDGEYYGQTQPSIESGGLSANRCVNFMAYPPACLEFGIHDRFFTVLSLEPGYHEILLRVRESYFDGGKAFIIGFEEPW